MGRRGIATFGLGVTSGVAAYALVASGVLTGLPGDLLGAAERLVQSPAAAEELPAFDDCEELRRWYVRAALPQVGPWGLAGPPVPLAPSVAGDRRMSEAAGPAKHAVGASGTGTNVQEADVDESDVAKTDGRIVVRVEGRALVVTDVTGSTPRELSRTTLTGPPTVHPEVLLHGDRVLVVSDEPSVSYRGPIVDGREIAGEFVAPSGRDSSTHMASFDVSDPTVPRLTDRRSIDGSLVSTREYADGTVRVVLTSGYPPLDFVQPNRDRTPAQATKENRRIVRAAPAEAWLPTVSSGTEKPLLECTEVRHPRRPAGFGTVSVVGFSFDDPDRTTATGLTASGDLVYSSADRLYAATSGGATTTVHAFALDGPRTSYVGSGSVPGTVKDRWSFSEYDGHLRVASTTDSQRQPASTVVTVLAERGDRLVRTGHVGGLGVDEQVKAVRWFGDVAVVVTFRQIDPLYTLDLSDPARPRVLGELKAPGFSSYLHPVGGDLLVGLGHEATTKGADLGTQAATFDLSDLGDVRRTDTLDLGRHTVLAAEADPRAVTYLPEQRTLITPVTSWDTAGSRFVALHVSRDGQLSETASWAAGPSVESDVRALPLGGGRIVLVDGTIRVVRLG